MSRIKSSVKMGQGRRRRGPALASAGQRPVWRASLRLRRSRPAALGPRGLCLAAPGWPPSARVSGRPRSTVRLPQGSRGPPRPGMCGRPAALCPAEVDGTASAGVRDHRIPARPGAPLWPAEVDSAPAVGVGGPPQPGTRWRPALAGRGRLRAGCGGRRTTTARHPRAPCAETPRSTTRRPRGSGDCRSPARASAPDRAHRGRAPARGGTPLCPAEKGGEVKNGACHLSRNNA